MEHEIRTSADNSELILLLHLPKVPAETLRVPIDLAWHLFESDEDPSLVKLVDPVHQVLQRQSSLSRTGATCQQDSVALHEPASQHLIQFRDSSPCSGQGSVPLRRIGGAANVFR